MIKNAFTGEPLMRSEKRELSQKEQDDQIMIPFGDRGEMRPKSRGRSYPQDQGVPEVDQTARDQCDINNIMKRYEKTGELEELIRAGMTGQTGMQYGDFSDPVDFKEALNITIHAKDQFNRLDAHIRNRFDNDPAKFLEFVGNERNADEIERMGLMSPEAVERRQQAALKGNSTASKQSGKGKPTPPSPADPESNSDE